MIYLFVTGFLIYGGVQRGRAAGMSSQQRHLRAWGAAAVGLAVAFGTQFLLGFLLGLLLPIDILIGLGIVWTAFGAILSAVLGLLTQHLTTRRLIPEPH